MKTNDIVVAVAVPVTIATPAGKSDACIAIPCHSIKNNESGTSKAKNTPAKSGSNPLPSALELAMLWYSPIVLVSVCDTVYNGGGYLKNLGDLADNPGMITCFVVGTLFLAVAINNFIEAPPSKRHTQEDVQHTLEVLKDWGFA